MEASHLVILNFQSQGTFGNTHRHSGLSQLGDDMLVSNGWVARDAIKHPMMSRISHHNMFYLATNTVTPGMRNPSLTLMAKSRLEAVVN